MSGGTLLKGLFAFALLTTQQLISRLPQEKINSCHPSSSYLCYVWLRWHWVQVSLHTKRVHTFQLQGHVYFYMVSTSVGQEPSLQSTYHLLSHCTPN